MRVPVCTMQCSTRRNEDSGRRGETGKSHFLSRPLPFFVPLFSPQRSPRPCVCFRRQGVVGVWEMEEAGECSRNPWLHQLFKLAILCTG